jgi:hypothetical protein
MEYVLCRTIRKKDGKVPRYTTGPKRSCRRRIIQQMLAWTQTAPYAVDVVYHFASSLSGSPTLATPILEFQAKRENTRKPRR